MRVKSKWYVHGDTTAAGSFIIGSLSRSKHMFPQYMQMAKLWFSKFKPTGNKVAVLYVGGVVHHHSDIRKLPVEFAKAGIAIKTQVGYSAYRFAKKLNTEVTYLSVNGNACASALYAFREAEQLMADGYSDVVVYAEEAVEEGILLFFRQSNIPLMCGDGAAIVHLTNEPGLPQIANCTWAWTEESSPMAVSAKGYERVFTGGHVDFVKVHGSGTLGNAVEESAVLAKWPSAKIVEYKSKIGHTQGASALIETCMLLDSDVVGTGMILASGMGGFYGSARIVTE